ncbi:hypothetical protein RvVAT039_pl03010 (plasmid) [Agrobacterium vitis]|nr:hypothetical protein RvVAT039_pl03010 [Agrobacterium vitis]
MMEVVVRLVPDKNEEAVWEKYEKEPAPPFSPKPHERIERQPFRLWRRFATKPAKTDFLKIALHHVLRPPMLC